MKQKQGTFCCEDMEAHMHPTDCDHDDCPDKLMDYNNRFDEYSLRIHDGGSAVIQIHFCPWCGEKLPKSKRDEWFKTLERLGFDEPTEQDIPKSFQTDEWYRLKK
ncbi:hypothetical protein JOC54_002423 [Alkalihalobacillus xiaoxiensis]|uniref:DUF6980 domain-containing protein n=1 Tax=Shouchella xiaoxiensis TaxID=766895 RepID=A0ABS2SUH9_9BACI|nr:hypothetical protein [Shouchella xiaoxiensis]MBM7839152.1 hypothetical protein [Shouchella xiaoxiensis]